MPRTTRCLDAVVGELRALSAEEREHDVLDEDVARVSLLEHADLNVLGRYTSPPVSRPPAPCARCATLTRRSCCKQVSTDQQSTARQNLVLDEARIEDPVVFEEDPGTSSRLHLLQRPKFRELPTYTRPGGTVRISDHVVPLSESWDSGASQWTAAQRKAYANGLAEPRALAAVTARSRVCIESGSRYVMILVRGDCRGATRTRRFIRRTRPARDNAWCCGSCWAAPSAARSTTGVL
ncbi:hypothetical protein [Streptomyces sp. MI02-7b]|uniref:hypothetical protein n=1 Tax=Streptomyces sp. MI02-7b TaxID=462941 RepID=UPI0029B0C047|nr:hypothetical protein [Streptomyces sp. MI02-7b]MDX3078393.1 hypothetical protein [Streptomyces sp. MI02-7b]